MKMKSKIIAKIVDRNIQKEANSACLIFGYQPPMPKAVRKYRKRKVK